MATRRVGLGIAAALLVGSMLGYLYFANGSADADPELRGSWQLVDVEGRKLPEEAVMTFAGGVVETTSRGKRERDRPYRANPRTSPKEIDIVNEDTSDAGMWLGIYEVRGDTLRLRLRTGAGRGPDDRPSDFRPSDRTDFLLLTLKRR